MSLIVSTQGEQASFHHTAVASFFGDDIDIRSCKNFAEAVEMLTKKQSNYAVVAIENSLFGTINTVYDLLLSHNVAICGEVYLRIEQCLIGTPDSELNTIKEVHSHPVALAQCSEYLDINLPNAERYEHYDTAASVADVKRWGDAQKAAIAGEKAADLHDMKILTKGIETNKQNYTRFVVLERKITTTTNDGNKTSLILQTPADTEAGSLYSALSVFAKHNINLFALHSRPIVGKAWRYMFYIDIEIGSSDPLFDSLIEELEGQGCEISILGSYKNGVI